MFQEQKNKEQIPDEVMSVRAEQFRRNLICYLNIRLLQDYLLRGDEPETRMIWLSDLEQTIEWAGR